MSEGQRRLAAIMFTDMVGYTALGQKNEALSLTLVQEHRKIVRPIVLKHNGQEIKTMGDAFLIEFNSALEAVRCAYDIQRSVREYNISQPDEHRVNMRVGVHLGDVVGSGGDISGDAVNVASRIEPLAEGGGICLTRQVFDQVQNKFELPLISLGVRSLKNISQPLEVFKVVLPWELANRERSGMKENRLAVLPFANMSPDPQDAYFADGITEEIISTTSKIKGLSVISRTSVMRYKQSQKSLTEIGDELNAGRIVEGSVRKAGDRLRITVQLIDAQNDQHVWADSYDRDLKDIFAIQSDVAAKVAAQLSKTVSEVPRDTKDVGAYTAYIRAMQLWHNNTEPSLREAVGLFERAISGDPEFVRAYAGLSMAYGSLVLGGYEQFTEYIPKALEVARKAVELGPDSAEAHAALALVDGALDRFDEEEAEVKKAIQLNPNLSEAYHALGFFYAGLGRLQEGLEQYRKAHELDPLSIDIAIFYVSVAMAANRFDEALGVLMRLKDAYPDNPRIYAYLANVFLTRKDFDRAKEAIDSGRSIDPEGLLTQQGVLFAMTGRKEEAKRKISELEGETNEFTRLHGQLFIYAALNELDDAFRILERQAEQHSWYFLIQTHPLFESMRQDPRFPVFLKKVGALR